jgi:pilus assembly protein CpaF
MHVTLDDLVGRDMLTPVAASFLRAAVRSRKSIVVAGSQGSGKTTLVRALCAEIDPAEAIGTFETEYELHLHELARHKIVHAWEARPGSGERGPDGRQAGEFTLDEALVDSFRFNLSRQIVGEVRGREIWAMIKAMESGTGSISTTHAADAVAAVRKLVTCAMEAGPHITHALATSKLAATVDVIVQLAMETTTSNDSSRRRRRRVVEIIALTPGEREIGYATTHVFAPNDAGVATPAVLPDEYRGLASHGFDLAGYLAGQQLHDGSLA